MAKDFRFSKEWTRLLADVNLIQGQALLNFCVDYREEVAAFKKMFCGQKNNSPHRIGIFSTHRLEEIEYACADDLYRHAIYNDVPKKNDAFIVQPIDMAAHLLKWIMMFRPILLDEYWSHSDIKSGRDHDAYRIGNELYAIHVVAYLAKHKANGTALVANKIKRTLGEDAYLELIATLRYRARHQDVMKGWLQKAF